MVIVGCVGVVEGAFAQFTISSVTPENIDTKMIPDSVRKISSLDNHYFSESRHEAERRRLRNERNTITMRSALTLSKTGFINWKAGGKNTFTGLMEFNLSHQYKKHKIALFYDFDARYGINVIDGDMFKNVDAFILNGGTSRNFTKNWSYATTIRLESQFTKGYKSGNPIPVSDFLAPGNLSWGVGLIYKHLDFPLTIILSPATAKMTMVLNDRIYDSKIFTETNDEGVLLAHGVPRGARTRTVLGSSFQVDMDKMFYYNQIRYITYLYAFTDYRGMVNSIWRNTMQINVIKYIAFGPFCELRYNTDVSDQLQANYILGLTFNYNFTNKKATPPRPKPRR